MKENKFRAIREYDNQFVYGNLVILKNNGICIVPKSEVCRDGHHIMLDMEDIPTWFREDTLGQYTGEHDKNGKEIYDGDIVKASWGYGAVPCRVDFEEFIHAKLECTISNDIEVIGNVYENPDLLN